MKRACSLGVSMLCLLIVPQAHAQEDAAAQALWESGKQLLEEGRVAEACAKLGESYRLDPGTGALLLLANCHEREGKLASAWAELNDAATRAHQEGRADRETFAREHAATLAPRLSRLQVNVAPATAALSGLRIERNGVEVGRGAFADAIPVDGGSYRVVASAPGYSPWETSVSVQPENDQVVVDVGALRPLPPGAKPRTARAGAAEKGLTKLQLGGLVTAGVGVVGLGVSGFFALRALDKKSQSDDAGCSGNTCTPDAAELRRSALSSADIATVSVIAGGVLAATGAALFFVGKRSESRTTAALALAPGVAALSVRGAF
jgi:hypothetical protein